MDRPSELCGVVGASNEGEKGRAMRRRFSRVTLAITAAAIVAIAGGVTYAVADIGGGGVINGCYKSQNGQLRLIDPATDSCNPREKAISWNPTGPTGAKAAP